jgi:hypothetical protein
MICLQGREVLATLVLYLSKLIVRQADGSLEHIADLAPVLPNIFYLRILENLFLRPATYIYVDFKASFLKNCS